MAWTAKDIPDQTGRVAVVTGANSGLGRETARELARKGAVVVMAARNLEKAAAARDDIVDEIPEAIVDVRALDLASLDSVREFAAGVVADHPSVDLLVNNAGVMGIPQGVTADGFEKQFGTNHLGHFALTALLMSALLRSGDARVVTVTSTARHFGRKVDPADPHLEASYEPWRAYGQSKLANLHFAIDLDDRLRSAASTVRSLAAHPGLSNTDLQAHSVAQTGGGRSQRFFHVLAGWVGMTAARGALPQLRAATDPAAEGGELYAPRFVNAGPPERRPVLAKSRRPEVLATLWEVSERETGMVFDVAGLVAESRR